MVIERDERIAQDEPVVEQHRTTVINTGGERGGGGGTALAVVLLIALLFVLFLLFGRGLLSSGGTDINVNVDVPEVELPKVDPPAKPSN
jgi:uncharacterized membrane protein